MKMAKVVSVRDVPAEEKHPELRQNARRQEIETLLRRYPATRPGETEEIVRFLATGPHLDIGLIAGADEFAQKVEALRRTHRQHFRLKLHEAALFIVAVLGPAALLGAKYFLA